MLIRVVNMSLDFYNLTHSLRDMVSNLTILLIPWSFFFIHAGFDKMEGGQRSDISFGIFLCLVESLLGGFTTLHLQRAGMEVW